MAIQSIDRQDLYADGDSPRGLQRPGLGRAFTGRPRWVRAREAECGACF